MVHAAKQLVHLLRVNILLTGERLNKVANPLPNSFQVFQVQR